MTEKARMAVECDHCGNNTFTAYLDLPGRVLTLVCDACLLEINQRISA